MDLHKLRYLFAKAKAIPNIRGIGWWIEHASPATKKRLCLRVKSVSVSLIINGNKVHQ